MAMMRTRTKSRGMCLCLLGVALALLVQPSTDFARGVPGLKDSILAKRRPLHAGVARRAGAAQEDRRDLEEAADQRMRAEFVEEDLLLARQQLQLALAQQETAQAQVKTAQARAEESGDAKKVQAAERKVERAKKEVQEAKKEVQEAKKEDSLGPQVARWHLWRGAGRFNQQLRWRCSLQWPSSAWVLGTLRGLNFPDRPACF
ncbi:unnamed protein product [Effrenium voratum]|uniref:Uncharacterized protein n=1 Tax=Effrenium voratum TaxID=2562239 RepID=A0AA36IFB2_9DINO|nr:unnamed protein product [Effrenium voratum]CAJ1414269.1 unnamed protein product [Effrenium voratum]CAJ1414272.1 unnamed protein product [Effrenium voratum]